MFSEEKKEGEYESGGREKEEEDERMIKKIDVKERMQRKKKNCSRLFFKCVYVLMLNNISTICGKQETVRRQRGKVCARERRVKRNFIYTWSPTRLLELQVREKKM